MWPEIARMALEQAKQVNKGIYLPKKLFPAPSPLTWLNFPHLFSNIHFISVNCNFFWGKKQFQGKLFPKLTLGPFLTLSVEMGQVCKVIFHKHIYIYIYFQLFQFKYTF